MYTSGFVNNVMLSHCGPNGGVSLSQQVINIVVRVHWQMLNDHR